MKETPMPSCPVCGANLRVTPSLSKRGKVSLHLACARDGRDFRAFINNREYVRRVLDSLEGQTPAVEGGDGLNSSPEGETRSKSKLERGS